jgi:hypothetical protein
LEFLLELEFLLLLEFPVLVEFPEEAALVVVLLLRLRGMIY